eukprot:GFUD01024778.1.p1 GENE.GFUD01024778.1~~GFUD01024778.1.p1  ORF type:complete len:533 (+),score=172.96 GFUD01024778.1:48-1646(+)
METPGRTLILDLLAKSVAKINNEYSETDKLIKTKSKEVNAIGKRKKLNDQMTNKKKTKHEGSLSKDKSKSFKSKTDIKTEYIEIKTENINLKIDSSIDITNEHDKNAQSGAENSIGLNIKIEDTKEDKQNKFKAQASDLASSRDTAGRRLILDLLAKSVSKVNAAEYNCKSPTQSNEMIQEKKMKKEKKTENHEIKRHSKFLKTKSEEMKETIAIQWEEKEIKTEDTKTITEYDEYIGLDLKREHETNEIHGSDQNCLESAAKYGSQSVKCESHNKIISATKEIKALKNKRKPCRRLKRFSPEEDRILLQAVDTFGNKIIISKLANELNRSSRAVSARLEMLKSGKKEARGYTLTEDLVIMDAVMEHLPGEAVEILDLPSFGDWRQIGDQLERRQTHVRNRWEYYLKPWILQHFSGTLNLDIRRMLANYLADNFEDVDSIDWPAVARNPEFAGHTEVSLHYYFGAYLFQGTKLNKGDTEVTLKHVVDYENEQFKKNKLRRVRDKVILRQKEVINYFEQHVKQGSITYRLYSE